ncbi:MAG TPA: hypothetical protein PKG60_12495 [Spirochaetota bacterium]|nr:hypothetical protein [Spirochaetota bacterium]
MKLSAKILFCLSLLILIVVTGCETNDVEDKYNFKVMSSSGAFTGYYSVNGDSLQYFNSTAVPGSPIFHSFEESISSLSSILIYVTAETSAATGISIYLYNGSDLIKRADVSKIDTETINITLEYSTSDAVE